MSYLLQENSSKILQESGFGILLEQNLVLATLTETVTLTDVFTALFIKLLTLTETITLTATLASLLNALWLNILKSADGTWTKITKHL